MAKSPQINLYSTQLHPCSYLEGEQARTVFVDPEYPVSTDVYGYLASRGFRRSGNHIYRPGCPDCQACVPIRVAVSTFLPSRQQKRVFTLNQDLAVEITDDIRSGEHYRLYASYIEARHGDGDMFPPSREQYESFLATPFVGKISSDAEPLAESNQMTLYLEMRKNYQLHAVAVMDVLPTGLSAVYTFYNTNEAKRSLGVYAILFQIELAKKLGLPHLYLGYWIRNSKKMSYKCQYRPYELYQNGEWRPNQNPDYG